MAQQPQGQQNLDATVFMNAIIAQGQQIQALMTTFTQQTQTQAHSSLPHTRPTPFLGQRGADARRFMAQMGAYLQNNSTAFANYEQRKISEALLLCHGDAAPWATTVLKDMTKGNTPYADYAAFKAAFILMWEDRNDEEDALVTLDGLRQTGDMTVADYYGKFNSAAVRCTKMNDFEKYHRFRNGLSHYINVALRDINKDISTYDKVTKEAIHIDTHRRAENALYGLYRKKPEGALSKNIQYGQFD